MNEFGNKDKNRKYDVIDLMLLLVWCRLAHLLDRCSIGIPRETDHQRGTLLTIRRSDPQQAWSSLEDSHLALLSMPLRSSSQVQLTKKNKKHYKVLSRGK